MQGPERKPSIDLTLFEGGRTHAVAPAESGVLIDAADYYRAVASAIEHAERFILITGWQLDTRVVLRRRPGEDGEQSSLAALLREAAERHPALEIRVLPWSYNPVYTIDREWATQSRLDAIAPGRTHCVWDADHPPGASQHEKVVIIDGDIAFLGGIDLCDHRWDDRHHLEVDPRRHDLGGAPCGPYHDVQAVVRGAIVEPLLRNFEERWARAGGPELAALAPSRAPRSWPRFQNEHRLTCASVAIACTKGPGADGRHRTAQQIRDLVVEAIRRADRTIYMETQYFTSRAVIDAIAARFADRERPRLELVIVLPRRTEGVLEQAAVQGPQRAALRYLSRVAARHGHALGVFCPAAAPSAALAEDPDAPPITYVHSKLVVIDDRFLTIGSANMTNRSMGVDTEINLAWVAESDDDVRSIAAVRHALLSEHAGLSDEDGAQLFGPAPELLPVLVHLATMDASRLVAHGFAEHQGDDETTDVEDLLAEIGDPERVEGYEERARSLGARLWSMVRGAA